MFPGARRWKCDLAARQHCKQPPNLLRNQARVLAPFVELLWEWFGIQLMWGITAILAPVSSLPPASLPLPSLVLQKQAIGHLRTDSHDLCRQRLDKTINVQLLTRYFDLTPPFFICFAVLCLTSIHSSQPSNLGDPPFTNTLTRKVTCEIRLRFRELRPV